MPQVDLNNRHSFLIVLETERYDIKVPAWLMGGWEHLFWFVDGCLLSVASHGKEGLLLLSCFSRVWLCATPETAAHQAPLSLGFSRQEHWSGLPFSSPIMKMKSESEVPQSCRTLSDPMDCSLPGSSMGFSRQEYRVELQEYWSELPLPSPNDGWATANKPMEEEYLVKMPVAYGLKCASV